MAEFSWGPEFLKINAAVLAAYAAAGDSAGVLAAQAAWLAQIEGEAATRGSRGRELPPTSDDDEDAEEEEEEEAVAAVAAGPGSGAHTAAAPGPEGHVSASVTSSFAALDAGLGADLGSAES